MNNWQQLEDACTPTLVAFLQALREPARSQHQQLQKILSTNCQTVFGREHRFDAINCYEDYCDRVPIQRYEDLIPYIQRIAAGEKGVLCADSIMAFELTGGSTQGSKLIPYTEAGLGSFRQSILPWLGDLLQKRPGIKLGRTYWAISPVTRGNITTASGIPIGMSNDAAYFGKELEECILGLLAVPPEFALIKEVERWRYLTALFLLAAEDLSLISVWSPTFLLQLLEEIRIECDRLIEDIAIGFELLPPNPARAALIKSAIINNTIDTQQLWPDLDTISCWTDATAKAFIGELQASFPHAWIQGKGLLATEGVVTLPLVGCKAPVVAIASSFYEFIDSNNRIYQCHQLVENEVYRVLITTHSGLYRYDMGDCVRVCGWKEQTPLLEFIGRAGVVSDLCGEKLTEEFVLAQLGERRGFAMLAPSLREKPHYMLFLDASVYDQAESVTLSCQLDINLEKNPQYRYARHLGQLGELVVYRVQNPLTTYINYALERGQRLGDIKPPALSWETDWDSRFLSQ